MAKKSISDLERYFSFLKEMEKNLEEYVLNNVYGLGDIDTFDSGDSLGSLDSIRNTLVILNQEINIALMSNSIKFNNEEFSLYQASLMLEKIKKECDLYKKLKDKIIDMKNRPDLLKFQHQNINIEFVENQIINLIKLSYDLDDRIERSKARTIIEVDMSNLILIKDDSDQ